MQELRYQHKTYSTQEFLLFSVCWVILDKAKRKLFSILFCIIVWNQFDIFYFTLKKYKNRKEWLLMTNSLALLCFLIKMLPQKKNNVHRFNLFNYGDTTIKKCQCHHLVWRNRLCSNACSRPGGIVLFHLFHCCRSISQQLYIFNICHSDI